MRRFASSRARPDRSAHLCWVTSRFSFLVSRFSFRIFSEDSRTTNKTRSHTNAKRETRNEKRSWRGHGSPVRKPEETAVPRNSPTGGNALFSADRGVGSGPPCERGPGALDGTARDGPPGILHERGVNRGALLRVWDLRRRGAVARALQRSGGCAEAAWRFGDNGCGDRGPVFSGNLIDCDSDRFVLRDRREVAVDP